MEHLVEIELNRYHNTIYEMGVRVKKVERLLPVAMAVAFLVSGLAATGVLASLIADSASFLVVSVVVGVAGVAPYFYLRSKVKKLDGVIEELVLKEAKAEINAAQTFYSFTYNEVRDAWFFLGETNYLSATRNGNPLGHFLGYPEDGTVTPVFYIFEGTVEGKEKAVRRMQGRLEHGYGFLEDGDEDLFDITDPDLYEHAPESTFRDVSEWSTRVESSVAPGVKG